MKIDSPAQKIQANLQDLFQASISPGSPFIRFQLTSEINALLPMDRVEESLVITSEKVTPIPAMPRELIGMVSSRNQVFCIFDLAKILGLKSSLSALRSYQVIVLNSTKTDSTGVTAVPIGLAVSQLQGMIRCSHDEIVPLPVLSPELTPFFSGQVNQSTQHSLVLDSDIILQKLSVA